VGAPEWEVEGWVTSYATIAAGEMDVVSRAVSELTGYAPIAFPAFLRRHPETSQHLLTS
jgi:NAD(P)H dehydrogenase (quinone)